MIFLQQVHFKLPLLPLSPEGEYQTLKLGLPASWRGWANTVADAAIWNVSAIYFSQRNFNAKPFYASRPASLYIHCFYAYCIAYVVVFVEGFIFINCHYCGDSLVSYSGTAVLYRILPEHFRHAAKAGPGSSACIDTDRYHAGYKRWEKIH